MPNKELDVGFQPPHRALINQGFTFKPYKRVDKVTAPINVAGSLLTDTAKNLAQAYLKNRKTKKMEKKLNIKPKLLKAAGDLAKFRKEAGVFEWAGEHVVGPISKGVRKYYGDTNYEDLGENVVAPIIRGVDKNLDLKKGINSTIKTNIPVATSAVGQQLLEWLKSGGRRYEDLFRTGVGKLRANTPEQLNGIWDKISEHPYLTPSLAVALPLILSKLLSRKEENKRKSNTDMFAAKPLNRYL